MIKKTKLKTVIQRAQKKKALARFYRLNSIFGNQWAIFFILIGSRMTGKSYAVSELICDWQCKKQKDVKIYWMRISETSTKTLLANKASKLFDPDLTQSYNLDLETKGMEVFNHKKKMLEVIPLSKFGKLKGVGFFDKNYKGEYLIILDEFQLEVGEKRTSFDILYNFVGMIENIARTTKQKIRVILIGNSLEESAGILKAFNFIPEKFGRYYLKSKRCVIDYMEPTAEYLEDRKGSIADLLGQSESSNFNNKIQRDIKSINKSRVKVPTQLIKFAKDPSHWFVIWDSCIIKRYNKMPMSSSIVVAMKPYLDEPYDKEKVLRVIELYDLEKFQYDTLITKTYFEEALQSIRK